MPLAIQEELAQVWFLEALRPGGLRVQVQLAQPHTLQEAFELAAEREGVWTHARSGRLREGGPVDPYTEMEEGKSKDSQSTPTWLPELVFML
ncbi:UNVERIFIED_CONTAM: hypothetical protein FKN15_048248 [Acipenser sinensis]